MAVLTRLRVPSYIPLQVLVISFLEQLAFSVLFVFLTQRYLPEDKSLGVGFAGVVLAAFGFTNLAARAPAGWLGDRIGYRSALILGLSGSVIATLLMMNSHQPWLLLLTMAFLAVCKAPIGPALNATIANMVGAENRGKVVACHNIAFLGAAGAGGLAAFALLSWTPAALAFTMSMALQVAAAVVAFFCLTETACCTELPAFRWSPRFRLPREVMSPHVVVWAGILLLLGVTVGLIAPVARPYLRDVLEVEPHQVAPYLVPPGLIAALAIIPCGRLTDRVGRVRPVLLGLSVALIGLMGLMMTTSLLMMMPLIALIMLAWTLASPAIGAAVMDISREETRGLTLGLLGAAHGVGGALGPAIGGGIYEAFGAQQVLILAASLVAAALVLGAAYGSRRQFGSAVRPVFAAR